MTAFFPAEGGPTWIKFRRQLQNDCGDVVEIETRCRIPVWANLMACHPIGPSHLPHCRVLPPGEFDVMIPELRVTLQGAATGRIQWHVISEPRITLQGAGTW